jgi:hypothetical protein
LIGPNLPGSVLGCLKLIKPRTVAIDSATGVVAGSRYTCDFGFEVRMQRVVPERQDTVNGRPTWIAKMIAKIRSGVPDVYLSAFAL